MFQQKKFQAKYFLGWYPASLMLAMVVGSGKDLGFIFLYSLCTCLTGLFLLGLSYLVLMPQKKIPLQWEIVWWCYPPVSVISFLWGLIMAFARIA